MISSHTFAAIDFESAGTSPGMTDVPVQIGIASWSLEKNHTDSFVSYLQTDQPITWSAQKVHGITHDHLADAPPLIALWPEIKKRLESRILVAHGHGTEKRYLHTFPGHKFGPWVDTLQLYRAAYPELPSHALGELCNHFQLSGKVQSIVPTKTWHDALFDAVASLILLEHLITVFQLEKQPVDILIYPDTRTWHQLRNKRSAP